MRHAPMTMVVLASAVALTGCCVDPAPDFVHGSPRPPCEYLVDQGRVPYYAAPVLVDTEDWNDPVMVAPPVTDACPNDAIEISRDGTVLYFYWSPTVGGTDEQLLHIHTGTYRAERVGTDPGVFSDPTFYDLQKRTDGSVDGVLSFTPDGNWVYFHSTRAENTGYQSDPWVDDYLDIYRAPITNGEPGPAVNLGSPVNTIYLDGEHALSPCGERLYLTSDRPGGLGGTDIWVSHRSDGSWSEPVNLDAPINSEHWDGQPGFAASEPHTMYFVSNRGTEPGSERPAAIYRSISVDEGATWGAAEMVITGYVGEPSPVADGSILYFVHVLVDAQGVFGANIWYVTRRE